MAKKYRIGILGLTHDHVWGNLAALQKCERGVIAAACDPHPLLLQKMEQEYGCPVYNSCDEMLHKENLSAVYVFSDNAAGVELCEKAARCGLHILIEKPLAATLAGADRILAAARQNNVRLMVNWPFAWWPQLQHALTLAAQGDLGDVWEVKYRAAHAGPKELGCSSYFCDWLFDPQKNGGGALIDYCCYGAALARTLLGVPHRVLGMAGRLCKEEVLVEDNAVVVMTWPRSMALAEASWTQIGDLTSYITIIHGTKATLLVEPRAGGKLLRATSDQPAGVEIEVPQPPLERQNSAEHFLHCLETGVPFLPLCQDRTGRDAQEILEAALRSAKSGQQVSLPLVEK